MVVTTCARPALRCERLCRYCPPRCEMGRGRAAESSIDDNEARGLLVRMARLDRKDGALTVWDQKDPGHDHDFSYASPRRADKRDPERAPEQGRRPRRGEGSAQRDCQTFLALPSLGAEASAGCGRQRRCDRGGRGRRLGRRDRARLGSEVHAGRLTGFANFRADPSIRLGDGIAAQPGPYDAATMRPGWTGDTCCAGTVRDRPEVERSARAAGAIPRCRTLCTDRSADQGGRCDGAAW
jgi:hypothetical protein